MPRGVCCFEFQGMMSFSLPKAYRGGPIRLATLAQGRQIHLNKGGKKISVYKDSFEF
jgi:hypothetical protein